ncbi:MAG: hypothetical protein IH796_08755 [Deltaproteobacteria bacterium]|nr:hypothetical protein [Deltaproteobacteria bacterium]
MASQYSLNAEHHLHSIAQLHAVDKKLDVIVKAMNEIILAVQKLELEYPG